MFAQTVILNRTFKRSVCNKILCININQVYRSDLKIRLYHGAEKVKGSFLQNWLNYWKNVYYDYKEVAINISKESKEHPIKTTIYTIFAGIIYYGIKHNPDEITFREQVISSSLKLGQVGEQIRNPISACYVKWLEQCYNEGILRRLNLGIISIMWLNNYDNKCALYKTICPYLKPQFVTLHQRIIDIGFLDNWWILKNSMIDYDVNDDEHLENLLA
ncbi:PREDICTED: uncharacterized protein C19orf52 homolog [Ceratosolen solmsi marchali]|uniref:Uncharacterized protein C19orf52 homolog n=1 Tax=Ceratosolen solmsi marchali TaxID=326594 RepID=A0AAJ6YCV5_9HYME|nr:PREDICTED: uncharacterized protein C19orf52 homolog [Ceratosolen solmsi marchali]